MFLRRFKSFLFALCPVSHKNKQILFYKEAEKFSQNANSWSNLYYRERVEADGDKSNVCWRRLHSETTKVRTLYQANGKNKHKVPAATDRKLKRKMSEMIYSYKIKKRITVMKDFHVFMLQGLRFKKAHVTHPELKATFCLPIIGVKKNPSSPLYTSLGVITKGTVIEVILSITTFSLIII